MTPQYNDLLKKWTRAGGTTDFAIPRPLFDCLRELLVPEMRTLETGSGLSTLLFDAAGCRHTALEHDESWHERIGRLTQTDTVLCRLAGDWYEWSSGDDIYDLILIDGPPGDMGRAGVLNLLPEIAHDNTILIVDDYHRAAERELTDAIALQTGRPFCVYGTDRQCALFDRTRPLRVIGTGRCGTGFISCVWKLGHERFTARGISSCKQRHVSLPSEMFDRTIHLVREPLACIGSLTTISDASWSDFGMRPRIPHARRSLDDTLEMAVTHYCQWNRRCESIAAERVRVEDVAAGDVSTSCNSRVHRSVTRADVLACASGRAALDAAEDYGYL